MLSLQTFKQHSAQIMNMSTTSGVNLKMHYKGQVYIFNIIKTGEKYVRQPSKRVRRAQIKKMGVVINLKVCDFCGSICSHSVCVNKRCPGPQPTVEPQL